MAEHSDLFRVLHKRYSTSREQHHSTSFYMKRLAVNRHPCSIERGLAANAISSICTPTSIPASTCSGLTPRYKVFVTVCKMAVRNERRPVVPAAKMIERMNGAPSIPPGRDDELPPPPPPPPVVAAVFSQGNIHAVVSLALELSSSVFGIPERRRMRHLAYTDDMSGAYRLSYQSFLHDESGDRVVMGASARKSPANYKAKWQNNKPGKQEWQESLACVCKVNEWQRLVEYQHYTHFGLHPYSRRAQNQPSSQPGYILRPNREPAA
ncbi:hypothetical protein EAI_13517 [Harpegnathos saltator]|uniref:Uncharacterized protein n=1 Tax=Harpegnathos saltator TaxID=610380 RepID=E2B9D6_HARSA|nr:hypothetical protein EAI_13517 [Harpegnathos saltator]